MRSNDSADSGGGTRSVGQDGLVAIVSRSLSEFGALVGQDPERVTGARRTDTGWSLLVDLTELERIPSTTSVLATYRLDVDEGGGLVGYERLRRFVRGATD
ncbi:Gas vesicle synthesis protein GvpO [Frankia sp. EI5c]|uniref:gas vesicle protein GvpO n=1 Tax=Frankia sp. EI5c TaxID=683316 RepID=UPI0007C36783|nr:gas vesicle protein GvpO [Frankia sp. EI5c]OAA23367.1 Gas vesicle synthesis protein GvpO [Frankia sp. EI5c]